jgi:serine/threonine protein kinase
MPATKTCGQCGVEVAIDAMLGLCRACLFDYATRPIEPEPPVAASGFGADGRRFADYELGRQIGRGGMGVVYEAFHISLHRKVALKMILDSELASPTARCRFTLEAETAAKLDHPNIVPIYEIGEHQGQPFLSMKLITGESLRKKIASGELCLAPRGNGTSRTDLRERAVAIIQMMATIARAVHHAHSHDVLHRDLKPANIVVDQQGRPHLTDFGLAKIMGSATEATPVPLSGSGTALGTPSYMSPEQAAGQRLTPASDVYSLGTVLYEMLAGDPPFKAGTLLEVLRLIAEQEPKAPSASNHRVDKDLDTICLKCLEKDPGARYPTAVALAEDLERWLKGEPISARRVGLIPRTIRWARRNPVGTGLIASLCICLVASLAFLHARNLRDKDAERQRQWVTDRIAQNIENAWKEESNEPVTITSRDLAALVNGPIPEPGAMTLNFAMTIPDFPVEVATRYAKFLSEVERRMGRIIGQPVSFDLQLHKARSYQAFNSIRKEADLQGMTFLTYVRMKEVSPNVQPLVKERMRLGAVIFTKLGTGISNLTQVPGHSIAFAHTNSIISFLAKVALAQAGVCADQFKSCTNLSPPQIRSSKSGQRKDENEAKASVTDNELYAHREVLDKVLRDEFEIGVAPYRRFSAKQQEIPGLVPLHHFENSADVFVARAGLSSDVVRALRESLVAIKDTRLLAATKGGMREGFEAVTDSDFDSFRKLLANEWRFFETCQPQTMSGQSNVLTKPLR